MENTIKIGLVDDHVMFRKGLAEIIAYIDDYEVVFQAGSGLEMIELFKKSIPDVLLLDLKMPDMDGIQATKHVRENHPDIKIIVLSMFDEDEFVLKLMELGANGYLLKNDDPEELLKAIKVVHEQEFYLNRRVSKILTTGLRRKRKSSILLSDRDTNITKREMDVLQLIAQGLTNQEIGDSLHLSHRTIEGHRESLLRKTKSKNTAGLVAYAFRKNLLS